MCKHKGLLVAGYRICFATSKRPALIYEDRVNYDITIYALWHDGYRNKKATGLF